MTCSQWDSSDGDSVIAWFCSDSVLNFQLVLSACSSCGAFNPVFYQRRWWFFFMTWLQNAHTQHVCKRIQTSAFLFAAWHSCLDMDLLCLDFPNIMWTTLFVPFFLWYSGVLVYLTKFANSKLACIFYTNIILRGILLWSVECLVSQCNCIFFSSKKSPKTFSMQWRQSNTVPW